MATVFEALQNAHWNLTENKGQFIAEEIGRGQLNNAVQLLDKGYSLATEIEPLLERFGDVDSVPDCEDK